MAGHDQHSSLQSGSRPGAADRGQDVTAQNPAIFTICSNNYVKMAQILIESARQHHPEATLYLCLADTILPDKGFYPDHCEIIPAETLDLPDFTHFAFRYDVLEFNTAVKPTMFQELLKRGHDAIFYFDPDIEIFAPLDEALQTLRDGASFVLTPHLRHPAEGGRDPDDVDIMRAGIYNLGFLGVGATDEARPILAWWARRLRYQCHHDQGNGLFVDQKFVDLVPGFADHVTILRNPGYNLAYWNLADSPLTEAGSNWTVAGQPLVFFHFSGFDSAKLDRLSKYSGNFRGKDIPPALQALMRHYADRLQSNGHQAARQLPYAYGKFASGAPITPVARRIFSRQYRDWQGNPFTDFDADVPVRDAGAVPLPHAADLDRELQSVYASTSWRVTKPLRLLATWLRRAG
jgi:hypothetical protein